MNTEMLYELYEITEKNDAPDLATVGMAMLREKHPEITHAYPDREAFEAAVEAGIQADKEAAEQVEQEHE